MAMAEALDEATTEVSTQARAHLIKGAKVERPVEPGPLEVPDFGEAPKTYVNPVMSKLRALPIPWISAVRRPVVGAGCGLALAADLIVASETGYSSRRSPGSA